MTRTLVVDGANVVGSRPDGWWTDRAGAARRLHERLLTADLSYDDVVLVLEGAAKSGVAAGRDGHLRTAHASICIRHLRVRLHARVTLDKRPCVS